MTLTTLSPNTMSPAFQPRFSLPADVSSPWAPQADAATISSAALHTPAIVEAPAMDQSGGVKPQWVFLAALPALWAAIAIGFGIAVYTDIQKDKAAEIANTPPTTQSQVIEAAPADVEAPQN